MDYKNGKIYTIRSHQTDKYYIGSTCSTLSRRLSEHKSKYKGGSLSSTSREIIKYGDCYIELLEAFECKNKNELRKREGELIRQYKDNVINCRIENRTVKQYRIDNKEKIKQYRIDNKEKIKQYRIDNKEKIYQCRKQYRIDNKEKLKISKKKEYEQHKEHYQKYKSQWYQKNKKQISNRLNTKYMCECGIPYTHGNILRHQKSNYHKQYIINPLNRLKL